ncbi:hypothetical protein ACQJBY_071982 [Aegilops geniculata]
MALVPNCPPDLRIYDSVYDCGLSSRREQAEHRSRLLDKIRDSYRKALERLNPRARPGMAARFLRGGGSCLGFVDLVSNILANTLVSHGRAESEPESAGECDLVYVPEEKLRDLERRSLDGLVTFLTRFFPYLPDCHAVRFLLLADAHPMVALRIAASDLGISRIGSDKRAFDEALGMAFKCAAMAAKHPDPDRLLCDWLAISGRLPNNVGLLAEVRRRSPPSTLDKVAKLVDGSPLQVDSCLWLSFLVAGSRLGSVPHLHSSALKGTLQDAVHGFYLQALARLPAGELRSRFHRSLLVAGNCYGPLDPVSNIIINTIWYDAAFPPTAKLEVDVIGTMILHRMENCSLFGLVSFLCTRHHHIDFNQAIRCLLQANGNLLQADRRLDAGFRREFTTGLEKSFLAAAKAAYHPNPDAQAKLLHSCPSQQISRLLQGTGQLSSEDVQCLARLLCPEAACSEQPLRPHPDYLFSHTRISKKISAALSAYAAMLGGETMYELHTICGVNECVSGPVGTDAKCYHTHANFLATPKGSQFPTGTTPLLFFAEVCNGDDEHRAGAQPFVCPVSVPLPCAERVRCLYCDHMGIRIVHPVWEDFHGRKLEFEKMVRGEDPCDKDFDPAVDRPYYTNMKIIDHSRVTTERLNGRVEEDRLYNDPLEDSSDGYGSDLTLMSEEYDSDLDLNSMMTDERHVYHPMVITSCGSVY